MQLRLKDGKNIIVLKNAITIKRHVSDLGSSSTATPGKSPASARLRYKPGSKPTVPRHLKNITVGKYHKWS